MTKRTVLFGMIAIVVVASVSLAMAAPPTSFGQTFCDGWTFGNAGPAGNSSIMKLNGARSEGTAYADVCGGDDDGTYTWRVQHGQVNTDSDFGTEHGTFTFASSDPGEDTLGAIFNGLITVYDPVNCSPSEDRQAHTVYQSSGHYNSLRNNDGRTGSDSTFHTHGTYVLEVTADNTSGSAKCHVEITLSGLQN